MRDGAADKVLNFRPVLFCALFLCFGIAFAHTVRSGGEVWLWLVLALPISVPFAFCRSLRALKKTAFAVLALAVSFSVGAGAFSLYVENFTESGTYKEEYVFTGRVVDRTETDGYFSVTLDRLNIGGTEEDGKLVAYLPASFAEKISLADEVLLRGTVQNDRRLFSDGGFRSYAVENDIRFYAEAEQCAVTGDDPDPFLLFRDRLETAIRAGMDETPASVTIAVLTGNTDLIDSELLDNVRRGGIAHIFAVSGLHVGALFAFCLLLVKKTGLRKLPKPARFFLVAAVIVFYGGACGFSSSVVRAIVMCLVLYASNLVGIGTDSIENISLAAIVVLLLSPASLFSVGFQLSFAACYGIAFLSRPIRLVCFAVGDTFVREEKKAEREDHPPTIPAMVFRACVSYFSVTLAAQIATAPLLLHAFGYLSVWSLVLNCLVVPLVSAAFPVLLLFAVAASVLPLTVAPVLLYVPNLVWSAFLLLFRVADFASLTPALFTLKASSFPPYYLAFTFLSDKWNMPRGLRYTLFAVLFGSFLVTGFAPAAG